MFFGTNIPARMRRMNIPAIGVIPHGSVEIQVACQFIFCVRHGISTEVIKRKHPIKRCRPIN